MRTFSVVVERDPDTSATCPAGQAPIVKGRPLTNCGRTFTKSWKCCSKMASRSSRPKNSSTVSEQRLDATTPQPRAQRRRGAAALRRDRGQLGREGGE